MPTKAIASEVGRASSTGSPIAAEPKAATLAAVSSAAGRVRVIQTRVIAPSSPHTPPGGSRSSDDQYLTGLGPNLAAQGEADCVGLGCGIERQHSLGAAPPAFAAVSGERFDHELQLVAVDGRVG